MSTHVFTVADIRKTFLDFFASKAAEQDILLGPGHLFSVDLEPSPWLRFNVAWSDDDALLRFLVTLKAA